MKDLINGFSLLGVVIALLVPAAAAAETYIMVTAGDGALDTSSTLGGLPGAAALRTAALSGICDQVRSPLRREGG